ncbi:hypothetical protein AB0N17_46720, partial [Streptomyces sp. NPDC051133]
MGLAKPYPLPDSRDIFQGESGRGSFSLGHDRLGDGMAGVPDVPGVAAGALLQPAFRGLGVLLLELGPQGKLTLAVAVAGRGRQRDGIFYLTATSEVPEAEQYEPDGFIGVDLGIASIATTSTGYQASIRSDSPLRYLRSVLSASAGAD